MKPDSSCRDPAVETHADRVACDHRGAVDILADRQLHSRLATVRLARRLYLANLAVSVSECRELRSDSTALRAEAQLAYSVARRRMADATAAWP